MREVKFALGDIKYKIDVAGRIWRSSESTGHRWMRSIHGKIQDLKSCVFPLSLQASQIVDEYDRLHCPHPADVF